MVAQRQGGELPPTEDDMPDFIRGAGGRLFQAPIFDDG